MRPRSFDILGDITDVETIAVGRSIRELDYLNRKYGRGRWRKCKGVALICYNKSGRVVKAEIHWYEAHGIGAEEWKIKRELE